MCICMYVCIYIYIGLTRGCVRDEHGVLGGLATNGTSSNIFS